MGAGNATAGFPAAAGGGFSAVAQRPDHAALPRHAIRCDGRSLLLDSLYPDVGLARGRVRHDAGHPRQPVVSGQVPAGAGVDARLHG